MDYTTTELIEDLKSRINSPTSDQASNTDRYIRVLNRTMLEEMVPFYLDLQSNIFLSSQDMVPDNGVVTIPQRAIGSKVKDFNIINGDDETEVPQIDVGRRVLNGWFFRADKIVLNPVNLATSFRLWYHRRPGFLTKTSLCAQISAIDTGLNTVTVSSIPSTWTTSTRLDFIKGFPGFQGVVDGQTATNITTTVLTFASIPTGLEVGDWLAPEFHSPIPQIPVEGHGILAQKAAGRIQLASGALQLAGATMGKEKEIVSLGKDNSSPRADNEPRKIINRQWESGYSNGYN
jgi:hypothetical protein